MAEGTVQPNVKLGGKILEWNILKLLSHHPSIDTQDFSKGFIFTGDARAAVVFCTSL